MRRPTSELVALAWLGSLDGLTPQMVATTLPTDDRTWAPTGFVTVVVTGGSPHAYLPVKNPVFQVDCWATNPRSNKPPWWRANELAEAIRYGCLANNARRLLPIGSGGVTYPPAVVQSASMVTEPQRRYGDTADYAIYSFDLAMSWVTAGDVLTAQTGP